MASEDLTPIPVRLNMSPDSAIAVIQNDIKHIKEAIDEIKERQKKQDEIIALLQSNCNREERWKNYKEQVESHEERLSKVERGKCPKLSTLDDHEDRIVVLESTHLKDTGAKDALISYRELAAWGLTGLLGIITIWQFMEGRI